MQLTVDGINYTTQWEAAGITLPGYNASETAEEGRRHPVWMHFGIGNIFRIFLGGIADSLLEQGLLNGGITCVETFDYETVDKIYRPFDNLSLSVILENDGSRRQKVIAPFAEAIKGRSDDSSEWNRLMDVFSAPTLQMVSFTITEKGYALKNASGAYFGFVQEEIEKGPSHAVSAPAIIAAGLLSRFEAGAAPLALVSMDNCSHNGERLRDAVLEIARAWTEKGFAGQPYLDYVENESVIAFPWTMIDKITPRPSEQVAADLTAAGVEDMDIVITSKRTYIAPFVNAEGPQYLVVEDSFPNGRPPLERAGVYMTNRETVNKSERMKVTVCLNPIHTALAPVGCVLGYQLFSDEMADPQLLALAKKVGLDEGMEFVEDPGILSPKDFIEECLYVRFPNPYLGDTPQRIAVDTSQMLGIRFGENIKACVRKYGNAEKLRGITLAIAGWLRYLLALDDEGKPFELSPDPMNDELTRQIEGIGFGSSADAVSKAVHPILANANIFGIDLYEAGIGKTAEQDLLAMLAGPGAVRKHLLKVFG